MNPRSAKPAKGATWSPESRLTVRVPTPDRCAAFDHQLAAAHCLGAGRPVGDDLRPVVEHAGQPVALLVGGPACDALKERDRRLSWGAPQRRERLKLLVQNRRFLLLTPKGSAPVFTSPTSGPKNWDSTRRTPMPRPSCARHHGRRDALLGEDDSRSRHATRPVNLALPHTVRPGVRTVALAHKPCRTGGHNSTPTPPVVSPSSPHLELKIKDPAKITGLGSELSPERCGWPAKRAQPDGTLFAARSAIHSLCE